MRYPFIVITEPIEEIAPEDASRLFERLLSSKPFRQTGNCRSVLELLIRRWTDRKGPVSPKDLLTHLRRDENTQISPIKARIRKKLDIFNRDSDCQFVFTLPEGKGNCQLVIERRSAHREGDGGVSIIFGRSDPKDPFEDIICRSKGSVLFVGIASLPVLAEHIEPWFNSGSIRTKHFRVLTWRPRSGRVIEACAKHIGQETPVLKRNINAAWKSWRKIEQDHAEVVEVYSYSVFPMALSVYDQDQMKVELVPFNRIGGQRGSNNRPTILLNRTDHPREFEYFRDWFEDLWFDAMFQALKNKEVLPGRRKTATELLRKRGFNPAE